MVFVLLICLLQQAELETRTSGQVGERWEGSQCRTAASAPVSATPQRPLETHAERDPPRIVHLKDFWKNLEHCPWSLVG